MNRQSARPVVGALVYKGNGTTAYRIWGVRGSMVSVVKASTTKDPVRGCWYSIDRFTQDA